LSCFDPKPPKSIPHCDKIWQSRDKIKKEKNFRVIKDKEHIIGYIDEEYVDKIFSPKKNPHPQSEIVKPLKKEESITKTLEEKNQVKDFAEKLEPIIKKNTEESQEPVEEIKNIKSPIKKSSGEEVKSDSPQKKTSIKKDVEIDFSKLNFYFSDLKSSQKQGKKVGSFKINLDNTNETKVSNNFWGKLICKVEIVGGDEVVLTNWQNMDVRDQSLLAIKKTFGQDNNVSLKFSLEKSVKVKVSFCYEGDPEKKLVVKNGGDEFLEL